MREKVPDREQPEYGRDISWREVWTYASRVRESRQVIHCITNVVTVNDCANILLAAGASPIMAHHVAEMEEIQSAAGALVGNLGATESYDALEIAARKAAELGHPVVIDPVGTAGSSFRREFFRRLTSGIPSGKCLAVRGNYAEIRALSRGAGSGSGVDSRDSGEGIVAEAEKLAEALRGIVIASGPADVVTDGRETLLVENGSAMMRKITGSGCMASCLLGAYLAGIPSPERIPAAAAACAVMGICGEIAEEQTAAKGGGTMTFRQELIDAVSLLTEEKVRSRIRVRRPA